MEYQLKGIKRFFENDALIAFIDLLGTCKFYENGLPEDQANKIVQYLLTHFRICFSEHFQNDEIKENFDVSIFADSIVVSQRKRTHNIVERLLEFLLDYQVLLLLNHKVSSRAIIIKDSFFSFKVIDASTNNILGSPNTRGTCKTHGQKHLHHLYCV